MKLVWLGLCLTTFIWCSEHRINAYKVQQSSCSKVIVENSIVPILLDGCLVLKVNTFGQDGNIQDFCVIEDDRDLSEIVEFFLILDPQNDSRFNGLPRFRCT